jgi:hypothetical protein
MGHQRLRGGEGETVVTGSALGTPFLAAGGYFPAQPGSAGDDLYAEIAIATTAAPIQ